MDGFKVRVTGTIELRAVDASNLRFYAEDLAEGLLWSELTINSASVEGGITIEVEVEQDDVEVAISDIDDFDAESYLDGMTEHLDVTTRNADFDITDSPSGFDEVEAATDRETAVTVYVALSAAGFDVI